MITFDSLEAIQKWVLSRIQMKQSFRVCGKGNRFVDSVSGGTPPYIGTSTNQSGNIISSNMIGDSILGEMCSGVWDVVLTDVNGCTSSLMLGGVGQETVTYNYTTSSQINQSTVQHVLCYGSSTGSLDVLSPNPNTANYAYNWVHALTGTSVGTGNTISNLSAGIYILEAQLHL